MIDWVLRKMREFEANASSADLRRFRRIRGEVENGLEGAAFYDEVAKIRHEAILRKWAGAFLLGAGLIAFSEIGFMWLKLPIAGVLCLIGTLEYVAGRWALRSAFREYCRRRILPYQYALRRKYPEFVVYVPKFKNFVNAEDLRELERFFFELIKRDVELAERRRLRKRWDARNEKLRAELVQFVWVSAIPEPMKQGVETKILEIWDELPRNPERRKKYAARVMRNVQTRAFEGLYANSPAPAADVKTEAGEAIKDDPRLALLEAEARECSSPEAVNLLRQAAQAADRRTKIRLLKQAIREDRAAEDEQTDAQASQPAREVETSKKEVRFIVLDEEMEKRFDVAQFVPAGFDPDMVKEILLELLDPGSRQRRFQKAYRPETTLRRRVRQRYESWCAGSYDPRAYENALAWLVREGVLRTKPKPKDGRVYSLSANMEEANGPAAQAIVGAVLRLDRELRSI